MAGHNKAIGGGGFHHVAIKVANFGLRPPRDATFLLCGLCDLCARYVASFSSFSAQKEGLHAVPIRTTEEEPIISSGWPPAAEAALDVASQ